MSGDVALFSNLQADPGPDTSSIKTNCNKESDDDNVRVRVKIKNENERKKKKVHIVAKRKGWTEERREKDRERRRVESEVKRVNKRLNERESRRLIIDKVTRYPKATEDGGKCDNERERDSGDKTE